MALSLSGDDEDYESDSEQVRAQPFLCISSQHAVVDLSTCCGVTL